MGIWLIIPVLSLIAYGVIVFRAPELSNETAE